MYISNVKIKDYKCFRDLEISFQPALTSIVGKNGSGKTVMINAIKTLVFQGKFDYPNFPKYISLEITDDQNEIGFILKEAVGEIPSAYAWLFEAAFLKESGTKFEFVGEKTSNGTRFYLKVGGVIFHQGCALLDRMHLDAGSIRGIQKVLKEEVGEVEKMTLAQFVDKALGQQNKLALDVDLTNRAFSLLQHRCFFVPEMRDLQEQNISDVVEEMKGSGIDPAYNLLLDSDVDPNRCLDLIFRCSKSEDETEHRIFDVFQGYCESQEKLKVSVIPTADKKHLKLKLVDVDTGKILTNLSFPSGILQKLFFNFVISYSDGGILFVEEPENNLHPSLQKHLFKILEGRPNQTIITTHSPEFISSTELSGVTKVKMKNKRGVAIQYEGGQIDLGLYKSHYILDKSVFFSDFVVFCEGESELALMESILNEISGEIDFVNSNNILILNLAGSAKRKIYKEVLSLFEIPYLVILDNKEMPKETGHNEEEHRYVYGVKDFIDCFNEETLTESRFGNRKKKHDFSLAVLRDHFSSGRSILTYLTPEAQDWFKDISSIIRSR